MKFRSFIRSGPSHRVRIALNLKRLPYQYVAVDLRKEQYRSAQFIALNPQGLVPALVDRGRALIQSPAIIEWLEERHPTPALFP
jgi:maleylpyruvate isomerase